jgi:hypothetical protein
MVKAVGREEAVPKPFTQVNARTSRERSQLPKLRAQAPSVRAGRRGLLWSTALAAWWRPVGVQRGIRAPGPSAYPSSWLTVVG